jgi:hypothetical protein
VQFERMAYEHPAAQAVHEAVYDQAFVQGTTTRCRPMVAPSRSSTTMFAAYGCARSSVVASGTGRHGRG